VFYILIHLQGTRKTLSPEILKADDPDSPSADLVYTVLNQGEAKDKGYVERIQSPGTQVHTFTQTEVDQGLIAYVHRGGEPGSNTRLALQVQGKVLTLAVSNQMHAVQ
jgi:chondroitin sulfate proteoglycan 4